MDVELECNDCKKTWKVDHLDNIEMTPDVGPYKNSKIKFNYGNFTRNMSSCPYCGSRNTKEV